MPVLQEPIRMNHTQGYLIGLDMGTSGLKCVAVCPNSGDVVSVYTEWQLRLPQPGFVELRCDDIWAAVLASVRRLRDDHGIASSSILAIGACALCPGLIALDGDGKPLTDAITFMDGRSAAQAAELNATLGEKRVYDITANRIMAGATSLSTIRWIKDVRPDLYEHARHFAHLPSWLGLRLTGELRMDHPNAAGTGAFDIRQGTWAEDILREAGVDPALLPALGQGVDRLGGLINAELIELGVPRGIPVAVGGGDTACTAFALGAVKHGRAFISLGTSGVITAASERAIFDDRLITRSHVLPNLWIQNGAMNCGGLCLKWAGQAFCGEYSYDDLEALANESQPGSGGIVFLPYLNGERNPVFDPKARGVLFGIGLSSSRADCVHAVMEGVGFGLRQLMEILEGRLGVRLDEFPTVGGGTRVRSWVQILADILGRTLYVSDMADAGAVGAAMLAGIASGHSGPDFRAKALDKRIPFLPDPIRHEQYQANYEKYLRLYPSLKELY